jgi:hypothetical protein
MIASQKIGKSFMGALSYNVRKLVHPDEQLRAELLDTNFTTLDRHQIKQEVELLRSLRPNLNRYVYHTSLNFAKEDVLDNDTLLAIAHEYLKASGFTNNQYLIFRHHDADHPHVHLLVNRISFDGEVVSDSNNYQKSEAIIRRLERQYGLTQVENSKQASNKAVKKDELEMVVRTGKPSHKMVLQEILGNLLKEERMTFREFVGRGEKAGINFLFNQGSTGRVSGVTFFYEGFKIKGQALGNQYKWSSLVKLMDYEQIRHRETVSQANERTAAAYGLQATGGTGMGQGEGTAATGRGTDGRNGTIGANAPVHAYINAGSTGTDRADKGDAADYHGAVEQLGGFDEEAAERPVEAGQDVDLSDPYTAHHGYDSTGHAHGIEISISEDIDDEAINGRNRRKQRKARTNRR